MPPSFIQDLALPPLFELVRVVPYLGDEAELLEHLMARCAHETPKGQNHPLVTLARVQSTNGASDVLGVLLLGLHGRGLFAHAAEERHRLLGARVA